MTYPAPMISPPLTFWQARVLLLLTLESQSVNDVADRIAVQGTLLDLSRVQQLLHELSALGLLEHTPRKGHAGARYSLGSGPTVEEALDQAYEVVTSNQLNTPRQK